MTAPTPPAPKRFERDFDRDGHHRACPRNSDAADEFEAWPCICRDLDADDWREECERRNESRKDGD